MLNSSVYLPPMYVCHGYYYCDVRRNVITSYLFCYCYTFIFIYKLSYP